MPDQQEAPPSFPMESEGNGHQSVTRFRFSLRSQLFLMTALGLLCGLAQLLPLGFSLFVLSVLNLAITSVAATGLLFAKGQRRAFCLGALLTVGYTWTTGGGVMLQQAISSYRSSTSAIWLWFKYAVLVAAAIANGLLCIYARRYFERTDPASKDM